MDTSAIEIAHSAKNAAVSRRYSRRSSTIATFLVAADLILLSGCSTEFMQSVKSAATEMTTPGPVVGPYDPPEPSPWITQSEKPAASALPATPPQAPAPASPQAAVQQPHRTVEPKPPPAQHPPVVSATPVTASTPSKGAGKLMTPNDGNSLHVNAREITPAQPAAQQPSQAQAETSASPMVATAPAGELIFKGPPRQYRASSPIKWIVLGVMLIAGAGAGAFVWFQIQRRAAITAAAPPKKEKPPEGFEMREATDLPNPAGHGPDTVLDA